jgi:hypothetical protein
MQIQKFGLFHRSLLPFLGETIELAWVCRIDVGVPQHMLHTLEVHQPLTT